MIPYNVITSWGVRLAINNLEDKLNDTTFRDDISNLIIAHAENYDVDVAGNMLINNLLRHID